jgi:hypothetical protein
MPYFKSEKARKAFEDAAAKVTFSATFEDLLAVAAGDQAAEAEAYRDLKVAQDRARLSFNAAYDEAGRPKPHTPESSAFWRRWNEATSR